MEKPSRIKQVVVIVALLLALAVSALAASFIIKMVTGDKPAAAAPVHQVAKRGDSLVGGYCDGCALMYIGMPAVIPTADTSAGWQEQGRKIVVAGTVLRQDGVTPAPGVIIYYWHTDDKGLYAPAPGMDQRVLRHGHIRGWLKTDSAGKYALYTIRPRAYPDHTEPEHIHFAVREPDLYKEYYIDELEFSDDPLLAPAIGKRQRANRGGSGIVTASMKDGLQMVQHKIILGWNIPDYPDAKPAGK